MIETIVPRKIYLLRYIAQSRKFLSPYAYATKVSSAPAKLTLIDKNPIPIVINPKPNPAN